MQRSEDRDETQLQYHRRRFEELKLVRQPWEASWQALADFVNPVRLRLSQINEGSTSRAKIIDPSATLSLRTLASGMHSGITSPARPWFKLTLSDNDLREFGPVKTWIDTVETRIREVFQASNIYNCYHQGYADLGLFGQSCGLLADDDTRIVRMIQMLHGQFWLARDDKGIATTLYRRFQWNVARIVSHFGYANVSQRIKTLHDNHRLDQRFWICHAVEPRLDRDATKSDPRNMPFLSNYWEDQATNEGALLKESGFMENPIIAPPWELAGEDHYASSPGMDAIGDIKSLQKSQRNKHKAIDKMVDPPMTGPTSMRSNPNSLLPGSVTYVDDPTGKGYRPAMEVNLRIGELAQDIKETRERIDRAFYADLFLMLANMEGVQPRNQLEISERKEEKLLALGPVLENIYTSQLAPTIDRTFAIMERRGLLPPPPQEIQGEPMKIEYISVLAQAQKAVSTGSIERLVGFVGNLAGVKPEALDKLDVDQAIDDYGDMIGAPANLIVTDDKVQATREARAQQQQAAQKAELAKTAAPAISAGADAAKVMADAQNSEGGQALLAKLGIM